MRELKRLRFMLPIVQLAIAIALTMHSFQRQDTFEDPAWVRPDIQLRDALNLPTVAIRYFLLRRATVGLTPA